MSLKNISFVALFGALLIGCTSNPLDVDVADVKVETKFINMDSILYYTDSVELMKNHANFQQELDEFYDYQVGYCMQISSSVDSTFYNSVQDYRKDTFIIRLERNIKKEFKDLSVSQEELLDGLKHIKYHLPDESIPKNVVYMNSLFNSSIWCSETDLGIGIERYLGQDNECIARLNPMHFHEWIKADMDKSFMERDAVIGWIETNIIEDKDGTLAEKIVRWGKILYLTKAAFPDKEDAWVLRYTEDEYKWAEDNRHSFWDYLVAEKLLFDINERNAMNMLNPGPTTPGLPEDGSPDRMGQYLGWKMVQSYLEQYDVTVEELIELPYNDILQEFEIDN